MLLSFWAHRHLIFSLTRREILGRYRGSFLGIFWSFINPVLMLAVYTFVFSIIFKARWGSGDGSRTEFALVLFAGLMVFNLFAECINRSATIILSNVNFVKKVIFPLEILPLVTLGSACFHFIISLSVWLLAYFVIFGLPHITILIFPVVLLPLFILTLGLSFIFASLGVYLRDLPQLLSIITTVLMFLTPIFFPLSSIPLAYRFYLNFNPLTSVVEMSRDVLYFGKMPDLIELLVRLIVSLLIVFLGFAFFQKTRKGFSDVL
jgi:lipopolysaccharide transport system permease protein